MKSIKFVIWGAGHRCQELMGYLGQDYVEAIIDESVILQKTTFQGVPIISKEIYLKKYYKYPVIITPLNAEKTIEDYLKNEGVYWTFHYWGKTRTEIGTFMVQVSQDKLIRDYDKETGIVIYGWSALTLIMYDFFRGKGFSSTIMLPEGMPLLYEDYIKEELGIDVESKKSDFTKKRILLAMKPTINEEKYLQQSNKQVISYYDLTLKSELFYNPEIEKFHNIYKGRRGFIVATGPSLRMSDLDKLYENHEICISMNKIYKGFEYTKWRPDYYIVIDSDSVLENKHNLYKRGMKGIFIGDLAWNLQEDAIPDHVYKWHLYNSWDDAIIPKFSDDFSKGSYWGMTITYNALQLAVYMGFSEIYLIGVDCCKYNSAEEQHFVKNYSEKYSNLRERESLMSYTSAKAYADNHNIKIYNASHGGKLDIFERVNFDNLFN